MELRISDIEFETTKLLESVSENEQIYACEGYNEKGHKYKGIAHVSCGEITKISDIGISIDLEFEDLIDTEVPRLRETRGVLSEQNQKRKKPSRELDEAILKIDEAILWIREFNRLEESSEIKTR